MRKIILASSSPRRKELLKTLIGNNFEICHSDYEEDNSLEMKPEELCMFHGKNKAKDVAKRYDSGIVIGCDTFVFLDEKVLGKPDTIEKAKKMIKNESSKTISVYSGLSLIDIDNDRTITDFERTDLKIRDISDKEIERYFKMINPLEFAGSFAVQGKGATFVESIDGCYFNVVGLPIFKLNKMLKMLEIDIFDYK